MLSRAADAVFWMSRYVERAENVARFVHVNLSLMMETPSSQQQWMPLVYTAADDVAFQAHYGKPSQENVVRFLTFDEGNPNSIISCLRAARENARSTREITSSEMWEQLNTFYLLVAETARGGGQMENLHSFFMKIKTECHTFNGIADATMTHGEAWHFLRMGRMIERADKTSRILDVKYFILLPSAEQVGTPVDEIQWAAVLRSASAFEMYRKRHGRILPTGIVDFLLFNREFPRAVRFCLERAQESLHAITGTPQGQFRNSPERLLGLLCSELAFQAVEEVIGRGLHEFIDQLQGKLNLIGAGIHETFFTKRILKSSTASNRSMMVGAQ